MASCMWDWLCGSTWKVSAMQDWAISMLSWSSAEIVPSVRKFSLGVYDFEYEE